MRALVAARFNPDLKAKSVQLVDAGKPAELALTAAMRNLILLANGLLKANRTWTSNPLGKNGFSRWFGAIAAKGRARSAAGLC